MPSLIRYLRDVDVKAITLVRKGANRQRIFLFKSGEESAESEPITFGRIIKEKDWSAFYVVVAEPNAEEDQGLYGDAGFSDVWDSEDEIRKAAHRFMENGAFINKVHESMEPYGKLVENAVALADFDIETPSGKQTIRKGSWYIAVSPTEEGKQAIDAGEISGVSIEGTGLRIEKSGDDDGEGWPELLAKYDPRKITPDLERSPKENWVDRVGGFPKTNWIARAATHLNRKGMSISHAIAVAVNAAKKLCATGDVNFPGVQHADPRGQADACKAVAEWEAMKARAKTLGKSIEPLHVEPGEPIWKADETEENVEGVFSMLADDFDNMESVNDPQGLLAKIADTLGIRHDTDEDDDSAYMELIGKRDVSPEERKQLADKGKALPGGRYPIASCSDVANAVQAIGRSKPEERQAVKKHILSQARKLGCEDKIPDEWKSAPVAKGSLGEGATLIDEVTVEERIEKLETASEEHGEKLGKIETTVSEGFDKLTKAVEGNGGDSDAGDDNGGEENAEENGGESGENGNGDSPTATTQTADIEKMIEEVAKGQQEQNDRLAKAFSEIEKLAEGGSTQDEEQTQEQRSKIAKAFEDRELDPGLSGLLT